MCAAALITLVAGFVGCKPQPTSGTSNDAGAVAASTAPSASARTVSLPPEPAPPVGDRAAEVPGFEAVLAKDAAYQALWTGPAADRAMFLSWESQLVAASGADENLGKALGKKKLRDAGIKLFLIFSRVGKFPDDFTKHLAEQLEATKGDAHHGVWAPYTKGGPWVDFSSLAAWSRPEDPVYLREQIAAKEPGAGPFPWTPTPDADAPG